MGGSRADRARAGCGRGRARSAARRASPPSSSRTTKLWCTRWRQELLQTHEVSDATYKRAEEVLGRKGVLDIIAVLGYYGLIAMTLKAFKMQPEGVADPFAGADGPVNGQANTRTSTRIRNAQSLAWLEAAGHGIFGKTPHIRGVDLGGFGLEGTRMSKIRLTMAALGVAGALAIVAADYAEARAGRGGSAGSRGSRTFDAPPQPTPRRSRRHRSRSRSRSPARRRAPKVPSRRPPARPRRRRVSVACVDC